MKFFRNFIFFITISSVIISCKKESGTQWNTEIKSPVQKVNVVDISKTLYDPAVSLEAFKQKYPWFQGNIPDDVLETRRKDTAEIRIYRNAISKIDISKLSIELTDLFGRIKNYYPEFKKPQTYLYSSALQSAMDPIIWQQEQNMLFIDITGFMGENNKDYKGIEQYFQKSMNPQNIVPKVSEAFAMNIVPRNGDHLKFLDVMVYYGKLMTLQDAFLPKFPDYLKINYTPQQYEWAKANEANIWNYFVENNLVFSDDTRLAERFINPAPFSKFYTEVDNDSSPQIGIFSGWQICRKFFQENPKTDLKTFLAMNPQDIFNQSHYKPKN